MNSIRVDSLTQWFEHWSCTPWAAEVQLPANAWEIFQLGFIVNATSCHKTWTNKTANFTF